MVTEAYCDFETAKLLKEKGFNEKCFRTYFNDGIISRIFDDKDEIYNENLLPSVVAAPTLQMAMRWLRDKKRYYIQIMLDSWACGGHLGYYVVIQKTDSDFEMMLQDAVDEVFYQTYENENSKNNESSKNA